MCIKARQQKLAHQSLYTMYLQTNIDNQQQGLDMSTFEVMHNPGQVPVKSWTRGVSFDVNARQQ
ncbi:MAG: hypothetical protein K0Q78_1993, partial [Cellvibrio sp.]|nr:hypothetical protein [Cellvibrio sp.]